VNPSIEFTPSNNNSFDGIAILEALEQLPGSIREHGLRESLRRFRKNGILFGSIPYKENIIKTKRNHSGKITSVYGQLHWMDEKYIRATLDNNSNLILRTVYRLPNIQMISFKPFLRPPPFRLWILLNVLLRLVKNGYVAVYCFSKE
jgi:hypothetical protein